jgi:hypothetical protein
MPFNSKTSSAANDEQGSTRTSSALRQRGAIASRWPAVTEGEVPAQNTGGAHSQPVDLPVEQIEFACQSHASYFHVSVAGTTLTLKYYLQYHRQPALPVGPLDLTGFGMSSLATLSEDG